MSLDLDKAIFASPYNAFKNDSVIHTGSISAPTSLTAGQEYIGTVSVTLDVVPQFSEFFAYFTEALDLSVYSTGTYGNPQWYPCVISASGGVGVWITAPTANQGVLTANVNPIIDGNTITVQFLITNPYSNSVTLGPLTVPFAFTQYSIAN